MEESLVDKYASDILRSIRSRGFARFKDLKGVVHNPRTLSSKLKRLTMMGLIKDEGGYRLTNTGSEAASLLERLRSLLERERPLTAGFDRIPHRLYAGLIRGYCEILMGHYGERLRGVLLFGSVARGDWSRDSDVDLLVVVEGWEGKALWERIRELQPLRRRLTETMAFRRAVEGGFTPIIQHYPMSASEASDFHRVYIDACVDGIILYDRHGFLQRIMDTVRARMAEHGSRRVLIPGRGHYWVLKEVKAGEVFTP